MRKTATEMGGLYMGGHWRVWECMEWRTRVGGGIVETATKGDQ